MLKIVPFFYLKVHIAHSGNPTLTNSFKFSPRARWTSQLRKQCISPKFTLALQNYTVKLDHDYKNYQSSLQKKL